MIPILENSVLIAVCSLAVAAIYFVIAGYILPHLVLSRWALIAAVLFFVGCALTHVHWAATLIHDGTMHSGVYVLAAHIMQIVGGCVFIRELHQRRVYVVVTSTE